MSKGHGPYSKGSLCAKSLISGFFKKTHPKKNSLLGIVRLVLSLSSPHLYVPYCCVVVLGKHSPSIKPIVLQTKPSKLLYSFRISVKSDTRARVTILTKINA